MGRIEGNGKILDMCPDPKRLEEQMLALSPKDANLTKVVIRLFSGKGMMYAASLKPAELFGIIDGFRTVAAFLPLIGMFRKYGNMTIQEFAGRFRDPFLRNAVRFLIGARPGGRWCLSPWSLSRA